jgi:hypothetical protein
LDRANFGHCRELGLLGVERANFTAYTQALAELGDFLYLDSDIIVLGDLSGLGRSDKLEAARTSTPVTRAAPAEYAAKLHRPSWLAVSRTEFPAMQSVFGAIRAAYRLFR